MKITLIMEQKAAPAPTEWTSRRVALATLIALAVACAFWIVIQFRLVFFSLFIAIVLSTALAPLINRLSRFRISKTVSILLISVIFLALVIVGILAVAPLIGDQWVTMASLISKWYVGLHDSLVGSKSIFLQRVAQQLPSSLPLTAPAPAPQPDQPAMDVFQQVFNLTGAILHNLILGISVLLLTGLWILEGDTATRVLLLAFPQPRREPAQEFLSDVEGKVGAYTRGLALLTLIMGALAGIAYAIIGLPNVLFLGVFAGLMEIVPLVGPLLGAIPAVLVAASSSPDKIIWVIAAYVFIQFAESHFIVPRVMDRAVGVNPVASLLAFIAFGAIFGFLGALLAVPLAAVIQLVLNRVVFNANPIEQSPPMGRNTISALRYEAQNLVMDVRKQVRDKESEVSAREDHIEDSMEAIASDLDSILAQAETDNLSPRPERNGTAQRERKNS
jgi:predicted PurR-regulated permease PerM